MVLVAIDSGATAGNVAINLRPPNASIKYRLLSGTITLTCDGTVANRYIQAQIQDGSNNAYGNLFVTGNTVGSGSATYNIVPVDIWEDGSGTIDDRDTATLATPGIELYYAIYIRFDCGNGVAGDSWRLRALVEQTVI